MRHDRLALQRFRQERHAAVRQYVGNHYSDGGTPEAVPLNLISLYTQIVSRSATARRSACRG